MPRGFLPGVEAGTYPGPFSLLTTFFCLFQKTCSPHRARPLGLVRLSETLRPAAARTVCVLPRRSCQRLFILLLHPRQRPLDVWCLTRGYHMLSSMTCRQPPNGIFTVTALLKRPRPRSTRQRHVPKQTWFLIVYLPVTRTLHRLCTLFYRLNIPVPVCTCRFSPCCCSF